MDFHFSVHIGEDVYLGTYPSVITAMRVADFAMMQFGILKSDYYLPYANPWHGSDYICLSCRIRLADAIKSGVKPNIRIIQYVQGQPDYYVLTGRSATSRRCPVRRGGRNSPALHRRWTLVGRETGPRPNGWSGLCVQEAWI